MERQAQLLNNAEQFQAVCSLISTNPIPEDASVVSGKNLLSVKTFLTEFVPLEFMPDIIELAARRTIGNRSVKN